MENKKYSYRPHFRRTQKKADRFTSAPEMLGIQTAEAAKYHAFSQNTERLYNGHEVRHDSVLQIPGVSSQGPIQPTANDKPSGRGLMASPLLDRSPLNIENIYINHMCWEDKNNKDFWDKEVLFQKADGDQSPTASMRYSVSPVCSHTPNELRAIPLIQSNYEPSPQPVSMSRRRPSPVSCLASKANNAADGIRPQTATGNIMEKLKQIFSYHPSLCPTVAAEKTTMPLDPTPQNNPQNRSRGYQFSTLQHPTKAVSRAGRMTTSMFRRNTATVRRDEFDPLNSAFWEVEPMNQSPAVASFGSSPVCSHTPDELRAIPLIQSNFEAFPQPVSLSRRGVSPQPILAPGDNKVAEGIKSQTAMDKVEAMMKKLKKIFNYHSSPCPTVTAQVATNVTPLDPTPPKNPQTRRGYQHSTLQHPTKAVSGAGRTTPSDSRPRSPCPLVTTRRNSMVKFLDPTASNNPQTKRRGYLPSTFQQPIQAVSRAGRTRPSNGRPRSSCPFVAARRSTMVTPLAPTPLKNPQMTRRGYQLNKFNRPAKVVSGVGRTTSSNCRRYTPTVKRVELEPLNNPGGSLSLSLQLLSSDDWMKKTKGLQIIQSLAQHHPEILKTNLHAVCLCISEELENLRSAVACAAIRTLTMLYIHLQKTMDPELEKTGRALLLKLVQKEKNFIHQLVNQALDAMVQNCSHWHTLNALVKTGLNHRCAALRGSMAQHVHQLVDSLGVANVMAARTRFTEQLFIAVSKMLQDSAPEGRYHGRIILQELAKHNNFIKVWTKIVPEKDRQSLEKTLKKVTDWQ